MTIEEGNRMIEENFGLLGACVKHLKLTKYRSVSIDDLWGVVDLAAVKAARAFDPAKGTFSTLLFATAEYDAYRVFYDEPRRQKNTAKVLSIEETYQISDDELEREYKNSLVDYQTDVEAEALVNVRQERADLAAPREAKMIRKRLEGYKLHEIGAACGISKERVRQLIKKWYQEYKKQ